MQEVFHFQGQLITDVESVKQKIWQTGASFNRAVVPAILHLAEESGHGGPESDEQNDNSYVA